MFFQYLCAIWNSLFKRDLVNFLSNDKYELKKSDAGKFSVITYNIAGLPQGISAAKGYRFQSIAEIGTLLNAFDIVGIQEDFNYNQQLYATGNTHPYRSIHMGLALFGDGMSVLSKFALSDFRRIKWQHGTGSDRLTPKGFSFCRIHLADGASLDLYNIHTNSQDYNRAAKARRANLEQLAAYIKSYSKGQALLVIGDFNAQFRNSFDNLPYFLAETGLIDTWVELNHGQQLPAVDPDFLCSDIMDIDNESESIDKIMYRSSAKIQLKPIDYQVEKDDFVDAYQIPLSDHWPVRVHFEWQLKSDQANV